MSDATFTEAQTAEPGRAPKFAEHTLVVYSTDKNGTPQLCLLTEPQWSEQKNTYYYGQIYVQFPDKGYPTGGASYSYPEDRFHLPESGHEQLLALQYRQRERAIETEKLAREAKAAADAVDLTVSVFLEQHFDGAR